MPAYVIGNIRVKDAELYKEYAAGTPAAIERHGGRYLVRGGAVDELEGSWSPERVVVLEFPSVDDARGWYDSDEYRELAKIRHRAADGELVIVEGV